MIIFGTPTMFKYCISNGYPNIDSVVNFNTTIQDVPQMMYLNPYYCGAYNLNTNTPEFDAWFINYISSDPNAFKEFINLVREAYNGKNLWILTDFDTETSTNVMEVIIKYILENYGYACNEVKTVEDLDTLVEGEFSDSGITFFDAHMENYLMYFGANGLESTE
jgi:hypothetical protein